MIVREERVSYTDSLNRRRTKIVLHASCDLCNRSFVSKKRTKSKYCSQRCAYACPKHSERLSNSQKKISKDVQTKVRKTCLARYGVEHVWSDDRIRNKCKKTMIKKYGSASPLGSKSLREKFESTMLSTYGVEHPMQSQDILEERERRCVCAYGVTHPSKLDSTKKKMKSTWLKTLGVDNPMKSDVVKAKFDFSKSYRKRIETLKKRGQLWTSKPERELYDFLCEIFKCVDSQVWYSGYSIDLYVNEIETYVQLDGVYWHGLMGDEHINEQIKKTVTRDAYLNKLVELDDIKLYRITDIQWNEVNRINQHHLLHKELLSTKRGIVNLSNINPGYGITEIFHSAQ